MANTSSTESLNSSSLSILWSSSRADNDTKIEKVRLKMSQRLRERERDRERERERERESGKEKVVKGMSKKRK